MLNRICVLISNLAPRGSSYPVAFAENVFVTPWLDISDSVDSTTITRDSQIAEYDARDMLIVEYESDEDGVLNQDFNDSKPLIENAIRSLTLAFPRFQIADRLFLMTFSEDHGWQIRHNMPQWSPLQRWMGRLWTESSQYPDHELIKRLYQKLCESGIQPEGHEVQKYSPLQIGLSLYQWAHRIPVWEPGFLNMTIVLETLIPSSTGGLRSGVPISVAWFLEPLSHDRRLEIVTELRTVFEMRNKVVHADYEWIGKRFPPFSSEWSNLMWVTYQHTRQVLLKILISDELADIFSHSNTRKDLINALIIGDPDAIRRCS